MPAKPTEFKKVIPGRGYFFDREKHYHYLDGKKLSGCTTVLGILNKPFLIPWAVGEAVSYIKNTSAKVWQPTNEYCEQNYYYHVTEQILDGAKEAHTKKKESAAEKGTDVHSLIEEIVKQAIMRTDGFINPAIVHENKQVQDFITWATTVGVKFLETERNIYSNSMFVGGIVDFICEINGRVMIGDIKTSKYIYSSYWAQVACYQMCLEEMGLYQNIAGYLIVKISDRTGFEFQENYDMEGNKQFFKSCLFIYRQLASLEK